jgi:transcription initiation factor TFIIF subunit alpha
VARNTIQARIANRRFQTDSDSDTEKPDETKAEDGDKKNAKPDGKEAIASGTSTKGNSTPSGKSKADGSKKVKSLKRPGSPNLSESSGNESSRKKAKRQGTSSQPSRASTPLPQNQQRIKMKAGSGSDGEGTAGEMSDGPPKKKIKLLNPATKGTPSGSRAGSPTPAGKSTAEGQTLLFMNPSNLT